MSTDHEWERWGQQDPYFGVITDPRFRSDRLDDAARAEFFASGQRHVDGVMHSCRGYIDDDFAPRRILDFGCGVGRLLIPFAALAEQVVGVDVSPSMLAEARKNCVAREVTNVLLALSDDALSQVQGEFDLVHSAIVLQHIEVPRGRRFFKRLIECLAPGGIGAIQLTYAKAYHASSFGQPPTLPQPTSPPSTFTSVDSPNGALSRMMRLGARAADGIAAACGRLLDPEMQMNPYNLSEIAYLLQAGGITRFHSEFTDHGGELGVFLYFRRPPAP